MFSYSTFTVWKGGSPIQNLIIKNFKKLQFVHKMTNDLDAGPIFIKKTISLKGSLNKIFERMSIKIIEMIKILIRKRIYPKEQKGKVFKFKRIKEDNSEIKNEINIQKVYDKIRMLDADSYPNAYIKINNLKFFFTDPILKKFYYIIQEYSNLKTKQYKLKLRLANPDDLVFCLKLHNENVKKRKFFSKNKVSLQEHRLWFKKIKR